MSSPSECLKRWLRPGSILRATAVLAGGTAAGQVVAVLASPVVSRLYTKEHFGTLGTFATVLSTLAPIACLRYESAISIPEEDGKAQHLLKACLVTCAAFSVVVAVLLAFWGPSLAAWMQDPRLLPFLWLLPLSLFGSGVYQAFSYWAIRHREFGLVARTKAVQGTAQAVSQIVLGLLKTGTLGLIVGDVAGRMSGAGSIGLLAWRRARAQAKTDRGGTSQVMREYRSFPLLSGPATILHTATTNFTLLIAPMYGAESYGLYFFGYKLLWAPIAVIGQALAQVYLGEASRWARTDPALMLRSFDGIVKRLVWIGAMPFLALTLAGGPLTSFIFGRRWLEAGVLVQIQAVSWWVMFVVGPVLNTLNILQRQAWQLWADAAGVVLMAIAFWGCKVNGWDLRTAVLLYSVAIVLMYLLLFVQCRRAIVRLVQKQEART